MTYNSRARLGILLAAVLCIAAASSVTSAAIASDAPRAESLTPARPRVPLPPPPPPAAPSEQIPLPSIPPPNMDAPFEAPPRIDPKLLVASASARPASVADARLITLLGGSPRGKILVVIVRLTKPLEGLERNALPGIIVDGDVAVARNTIVSSASSDELAIVIPDAGQSQLDVQAGWLGDLVRTISNKTQIKVQR